MAASYEQIAPTRPRIRRDVLFTRSPAGVLFHNADGGFHVAGASAYRFASLLVPHLDGRRPVEQLCEGLGPAQRDMVVRLVGTLYERGFARDVPDEDSDAALALPGPVAERFAPQIAYIDHYAGEATPRFRRFRDARVAVLGDDAVARWCVQSLIRNGAAAVSVLPALAAADDFAQVRAEAEELRAQGCPVEIGELPGTGAPGWAQLVGHGVVLATGADAPARTLALLEAGIPDGVSLLPAWTFGPNAVIGPLMAAGQAGCFVCAALRLGAGGDPADAADLWSSVVLTPAAAPPRTLAGPLAGMVGNMLAFEVFRATTAALPAETAGKLIVQDLESLDTWSEPLFPHPRCPHCAARGEQPSAADGEPWLPAALETDHAEPAAAVSETTPVPLEDPAQVLAHLESVSVLVQARAGVFRAFADEDWNQTPIKIGTVRLGLGHGTRRAVTAFDLHHVAGARIRALHAAARLYVEHVVPAPAFPRDAAYPALDFARLAVASGTVTDGGQVGEWARAFRLQDREAVLVPAAALRTFGPANSALICQPTTAGTGVGGSRADSVADGLLSALALDALTGALRGRVPIRLLEPKSLEGDAELLFLAKSARNLGVEVDLLELGEPGHGPVPVLFARTDSADGGAPRWSVAGAVRRRDAAVTVLRDLLGTVQLARQLADGTGPDLGDPVLADLDSGALVADGYGAPDPEDPAGWDEVLRRVHATGQQVLVAPVDAPDLARGGLHAAKVLLATEGDDAGH